MPSNRNTEYKRVQSAARQKSDKVLADYVKEGKALDRIAPATPEEKQAERDMGKMHNIQYNLTKSQKYR